MSVHTLLELCYLAGWALNLCVYVRMFEVQRSVCSSVVIAALLAIWPILTICATIDILAKKLAKDDH